MMIRVSVVSFVCSLLWITAMFQSGLWGPRPLET